MDIRRTASAALVAALVLAVVGVVTGRWGLLVAGIIVIGLGAALGPARIRH